MKNQIFAVWGVHLPDSQIQLQSILNKLLPTTKIELQINNAPEPNQNQPILTFPYSIQTKYYTADNLSISIFTPTHNPQQSENFKIPHSTCEQCDALLLFFDPSIPESFKSIKTSFTSFIPTYDPNIALLISLPTPAPVAPATIDTFINWSIENGFEFVDLNDSEEPEADTEFNEKFGVDRILEALESNIWDGCARNDRASGTVNGIKHDEIISDSGGDEEVIGDDVQGVKVMFDHLFFSGDGVAKAAEGGDALLVDFESAIGKLQALREMGRTLSDEDRRNLAERIALSFEMLDEEEGPEFNELEGKDVSEEDMDEAFGGWISASEFHSFDDNWKEKSFEENERDGTDECFEYQQLSD